MRVAILNAGEATDYLFGLVSGLATTDGLRIDVVDSRKAVGLFDAHSNVTVCDLRGTHTPSDPLLRKIADILWYYVKLVRYALRSRAEVFHIQWDNNFFAFDRTVLLAFYRLLGKKIVYTAHNLYKEERDGKGSSGRFRVLRHLYRTVDAVIVHTPAMQKELVDRFDVDAKNVHVVPHGLNIRVPVTGVSRDDARCRLGLAAKAKVLLFFGYIDRYKGPDLLLEALALLVRDDPQYHALIVGKPKRSDTYVLSLKEQIRSLGLESHVTLDLRFVPEEEIEIAFAAADCLVLPYRSIYQSGVIFLSYRFGVPIVATDVGSFREEIERTGSGVVADANSPRGFADAVQSFFASDLVRDADATRAKIRCMAEENYSWTDIGARTVAVYRQVLTGSNQK